MGPASFIIALLGCADGSSACQQVAMMPVRYDSREACSAATSAEPSKAAARDQRRS